ncbi:MAG TPA: CPBP family intramembrane glutamic endopeptidase [Candidatus Limnocylindrales bacterium]|nr:CPBP family intramembrane glutamic endopeptidase [Candidatus Limnocylindrales bacterium]
MREAGWSGRGLRSLQIPWLGLLLVGLLCAAALVRPLRPVLLTLLIAAYGLGRWRHLDTRPIAATLPVAAILAWGALPQPAAAADAAQCADLLAPPAVWRLIEAAVGLLAVGLLVVDRRASLAELGLRAGSRRNVLLSVVAVIVVTPVALLAGGLLGTTALGGSFFGTYRLDLSQPAALLPAAVFAVSNSVAEELAYRGAMRVWLGPSLGVLGANLAQAVVFGVAHSGPDFVGPVAPTAAAMLAAGFMAGVIARRSTSLLFVIAAHAAFDVPLFFYWACRVG